MKKNKVISIAIILVLLGIVAAFVVPMCNSKLKENLPSDSLKIANDSLLKCNDSLLNKIDTILIKTDSLKAVIDTTKKK